MACNCCESLHRTSRTEAHSSTWVVVHGCATAVSVNNRLGSRAILRPQTPLGCDNAGLSQVMPGLLHGICSLILVLV